MKHSIFFLLFFFIFANAYSQNIVSYNLEKGINQLEQQYIDAWKKIKKIDGYRIQITSFSGVNSKSSIENVAELFKRKFLNIPFDISYFEPNFRLRAGNYPTKLEAYKALKEMILSFPGAFVLKDQIEFK
jgi:hypothetical protein